MRLTATFKWSLVCLIPLTFAWKLVAAPPHFNDLEGDTIRFLKDHGFNVTEETLTGRISIMRATKGSCSMIVMEGAADGSTRDVMRYVAAKMDRQFVVFRGKIYDEQPIWLTVTDDWFTRYLRRIGISQVDASPLMVAADLSCAAEQLPWTELKESVWTNEDLEKQAASPLSNAS